jgi:eukaryotic-like serine/threonine-protein kinase
MEKKKLLIVIVSLVLLGVLAGIGFGIIMPQKQKAIALAQTETRSANTTAEGIALVHGMTSTANAWTKTPTPTNTFTPTITSTPTATPTNTPTLGIGSTRIRESDGQVQVYVPEGEFTMGDDSPYPRNGPKHQVYLDAYWIDQTEITNIQYIACVEAGMCEPPAETISYRRTEYYGNPKYDDYPVIYLLWGQAKSYCQWVGADLPTEAQWEKAARGTDGRTFPWGNSFPEKNMINGMYSNKDTVKVGSFPLGASPYGALDMAGNVYEFVNDCDDPSYYEESPYRNPTGPEECWNEECHGMRGGAWSSSIGFLCTYQRSSKPENIWPPSYEEGFRCANNE